MHRARSPWEQRRAQIQSDLGSLSGCTWVVHRGTSKRERAHMYALHRLRRSRQRFERVSGLRAPPPPPPPSHKTSRAAFGDITNVRRRDGNKPNSKDVDHRKLTAQLERAGAPAAPRVLAPPARACPPPWRPTLPHGARAALGPLSDRREGFGGSHTLGVSADSQPCSQAPRVCTSPRRTPSQTPTATASAPGARTCPRTHRRGRGASLDAAPTTGAIGGAGVSRAAPSTRTTSWWRRVTTAWRTAQRRRRWRAGGSKMAAARRARPPAGPPRLLS